MGTVTTVTISANTYNVYALTSAPVTDATTYHTGRVGAGPTAFLAASADNKAKALVTATDWIDRAVGSKFSGTETVDGQAREWPRDSASCDGVAVTDGTTPDDIAIASFILAGELSVNPGLAMGMGTGSNVKRAGAGTASVTFFQPTINSPADTRLPIAAMDLLKCYFDSAGATGAAGLASGVDGESYFSEDDFRRCEGFA
jgi:hypothetical protein